MTKTLFHTAEDENTALQYSRGTYFIYALNSLFINQSCTRVLAASIGATTGFKYLSLIIPVYQDPIKADPSQYAWSRYTNMSISLLQDELSLFFAFSWRDWSAAIIPGLLAAIYPLRFTDLSLVGLICRLTFLVVWLTLFTYFIDLSNQIMGVEEDRINKPDRPIPSGKVSLEGAKLRWWVVVAAFLSLIVMEPAIWPETLGWIATGGWLNGTPGGQHWLGKNLIGIGAGTWALLSASQKCINPLYPTDRLSIVCISLWCGLGIQCQDLRDAAGDRAMGRNTMPIVFGDSLSRWLIAFVFLPLSVAALWYGRVLELAPTSIYAMHAVLAYKIMTAKDARADHKMYMIFTYILCVVVAIDSFRGIDLEVKAIDMLRQSVVYVKEISVAN